MAANQSETAERKPLSERVNTEEKPLEILKFNDDGKLVNTIGDPVYAKAVSNPAVFSMGRRPHTLGDQLDELVDRIKQASGEYAGAQRHYSLRGRVPETANAVVFGDEVRRGPQPIFNPSGIFYFDVIQLYDFDDDLAGFVNFIKMSCEGSLGETPILGAPVGKPLFRFLPGERSSCKVAELFGKEIEKSLTRGWLTAGVYGYRAMDRAKIVPVQFYVTE